MEKREIKIENSIINAPVMIADTIQDIVNTVETSGTSDELKKLLLDLSKHVTEMAEHLPSDEAKNVAQDLETLAKEAAKPNPRRRWWEISIEGLKAAAANVGEIGKPVIALAVQIAAILSAKPS